MDDQNCKKTFLSHGVRPTQQRIAVYRFLVENPIHPSADTIYQALVKEFPVFSRTTIYNTLNALLDAGLIRCVTIQPEEQRFDATVADHGHFHCKKCGEVLDFPVPPEIIRSLFPAGFEVLQGDVFFSGFCPHCLVSAKTDNKE